MVISSLVVETFPEHTQNIKEHLQEIEGVEVHDVIENKIAITIEAETVDRSHSIANSFVAFEGVINVNLIYANFEDDPDIARAASK